MKHSTIGELAAKDTRRTGIFIKYGIDFCCGGDKTLSEVCSEKGIDANEIVTELEQLEKELTPSTIDYSSLDADALIDHILKVHHKYVKENIPVCLELVNKVAGVHGETNPETIRIAGLFSDLAMELQQHMMKEENILFPFIKQLAVAKREGTAAGSPPFGTVSNPINMMEMEHERAGNILKEISKLSNGYAHPENACNTFKAAYSHLKKFEEDLHLHIHLENNILFPGAIALEKELNG